MHWIYQFQLFLFDFDGLLVNTEDLHFAAYQKMCCDRGFELKWDFERFCQARSEEHTSELQSRLHLLYPLLFFNDTATTEIYPLSLHDALPICSILRPTKRCAVTGALS